MRNNYEPERIWRGEEEQAHTRQSLLDEAEAIRKWALKLLETPDAVQTFTITINDVENVDGKPRFAYPETSTEHPLGSHLNQRGITPQDVVNQGQVSFDLTHSEIAAGWQGSIMAVEDLANELTE